METPTMINCPACRKEVSEYDMRTNPYGGTYGDVCMECEDKYRFLIAVKEIAKPFIDTFAKFCNGGGSIHCDRNTLIKAIAHEFSHEHRYLQGEMITFVISVLGAIGEKSGDSRYEDARNEFALKAAKKSAENAFRD